MQLSDNPTTASPDSADAGRSWKRQCDGRDGVGKQDVGGRIAMKYAEGPDRGKYRALK